MNAGLSNAKPSETVKLNAVVAALAVLTGEKPEGVVRADVEYRPGDSPERTALLMAAAAMQREVSLPILVSDPLVREASEGFARRLDPSASEEAKLEIVLALDATIHRWVGLLDGKAERLEALAHALAQRGVLPLRDVGAILA